MPEVLSLSRSAYFPMVRVRMWERAAFEEGCRLARESQAEFIRAAVAERVQRLAREQKRGGR